MRVCGIDIKANEIIVCILSLDRGLFEAPEIRQRRINISNADDPKQLRAFQQTVSKLMEDYKVDRIAIKGRPQKGKFAGSASGFKLEATLQLLETHRAYLISAAVVKETQKYEPLPVAFRDTGLKAYQEQAFMAAYTQLVGPRYPAAREPKTTAIDSAEEEHSDASSPAEKLQFKHTERSSKAKKTAVTQTNDKPDTPLAPSAKTPDTGEHAPAKESPWGQRATKPEPAKKENPWKKN